MCRPIPGNHGSLTLFYARITDIAVGVIIVLLFDLVMPWFVIIPTLAVHDGSPLVTCLGPVILTRGLQVASFRNK